MDNRTYIYDDTIKDIIHKLNPDLFFKINRKFIINKNSIAEIIKHSSQKVELKLSPAPEINSDVFISKRQITECLSWLKS
jgi:DNA-binding LytR/AlgR family response regulator